MHQRDRFKARGASLWWALALLLMTAAACGGGGDDNGEANNGAVNNGDPNNGGPNNGMTNNGQNNGVNNENNGANNENNGANNENNGVNNENNGVNNGTACEPSGSPRWARPAGFAALSMVVDDSANKTYRDGQMEWNGSFVYDEITNTVSYSASWLPEEGPYPPLYDDGPISVGGHEAEGQAACDGIFSAQVYFDAAEETTFEYGLINEFDNWIWVGGNGQVTVPAGSDADFAVAGLTIPPFGDIDLRVTLDTGSLHPDYASFDPTQDRLYVKGSMISWKPVQLLDNGQKGDAAAGDGIYTFQLGEYLGPHDGLLRPGQEAQFVFVFFDAQGLEYKKDGDALLNGVRAYTTWDAARPGEFVEEEVALLPESRGNALNTSVVVSQGDGGNNNNNNGNPDECVPACAEGSTCEAGVCVPDEPVGGEEAPEILFVEPSRGPASGGNPVTITGGNFRASAQVFFGAAQATGVELVNGATLRCVAPAGQPGTVGVRVVNSDGGEGEYPRAYTWQDVDAGPRIDGVSPERGSESGGDRVTVRGANFQQGATVRFGDNLGADVNVAQDGRQIEVTTPPGRVGNAPVTVTNPDQQSVTRQSGFAYETEGVDWGNLQWPMSQRVAAGQPSEPIYGQAYEAGLTDVQDGQGGLRAQVGYGPDGSDPADGGWSWEDGAYNANAGNNEEYIGTVTVAEPGSYDVAWRYSLDGAVWLYADMDGTDNGYSPAQSMALVVFAVDQSSPQLNSVEPARGLRAGGYTATLRGSNFQQGARVMWGDEEVTPETVTPTAITVTVPAGEAGWADVSVVQGAGSRSTLPGGFVYLVASARNGAPSGWGPNALRGVEVTWDEGNLYVWLEGEVEGGNGIALYLDTDYGPGSGITNLSGQGEGALGDRDGSVDRLLSGALGLSAAGFGAEWGFGMRGPDGAAGLRTSESGFNDLVGWRQLSHPENPTLPGNFAWVNTSDAPVTVDGEGRVRLRISWATLYREGRPQGSRLALFARLTNQDANVYNNAQTLPMDNPADPAQVGAVLVIE
jgi:hypothetical protein